MSMEAYDRRTEVEASRQIPEQGSVTVVLYGMTHFSCEDRPIITVLRHSRMGRGAEHHVIQEL